MDFIWTEWVKAERWPLSRVVHHRFGLERTQEFVGNLNDAYLIECDPIHDPTYELRLYGALSSSYGEEWFDLLVRFLGFMQTAFQADPARTTNFTSVEIASGLRLGATEARTLGRLLSLHVFDMMNFGYGVPPFENWECGIPKGFDEIGQPGDPRAKMETILTRRYQPRLPSRIEERQAALSKRMPHVAPEEERFTWEQGDTLGMAEDVIASTYNQSPVRSPVVDVFLSHSSKDKDLVGAVMDLLRAALGLSRERIRCTVMEGSKLPLGSDTDHKLREEIRDAKLLIGLLTPASLRSAYVLFEMGARWGDNTAFLAGIFAKGASASALSGPMSRISALSAHNEADLHQMLGDVASKLGIKLPNASVYLAELKRVSEISRSGDPFVRYEGQRVKVRGQHKRDQYFVYQGRTHYMEFSAAEVCEKVPLAWMPIEPEDEEVLFTALDDPYNAVQMTYVLNGLGYSC